MLATNLTNEELKRRVDSAIEQFNNVDSNLRQAKENVNILEKALEQARGRVIVLSELLEEQQQSNGKVEEPEVVTGEVVS